MKEEVEPFSEDEMSVFLKSVNDYMHNFILLMFST